MPNNSYTVEVININGEKLHNCKPARARILLKKGRAKVVRRSNPFSIQLLRDCEGQKNGSS